MITKWRLFNFKSVGAETSLDFTPLTIFAGPNSSGKSTCIQSILLVCQTLRNPIGSRSVILNGSLARLGQFSDLKTAGSDANQILIGWELVPASAGSVRGGEGFGWDEEWSFFDLEDSALTSVVCDVSFEARADVVSDSTQLNPQLFSTLIRANLRDSDGLDHLFPFAISRAGDAGENRLDRLRQITSPDADMDRVRSAVAFLVDTDEEYEQTLRGRFGSAEILGCELVHFLPSRVALIYNRADDLAQLAANTVFNVNRITLRRRIRGREMSVPPEALEVLFRILEPVVEALIGSNTALEEILGAHHAVPLRRLTDALNTLGTSLGQEVQRLLQNDPKYPDEFASAVRSALQDDYRTAFIAPPRGVQASSQYMLHYFSRSVKYLGPLRDEPKALYPLGSGTDPFDVGLRGENTAAVLDLNKNYLVRFIPPSAFAQPAIQQEPITRSLQAAVSEWLRYLCVAESVESRDRGKLGHELKVRIDQGSGDQDLTHVGVGVSQVLPILVMCLLAEIDNVLIFEQPELHLHPRVQTLLADFFLSMALMNKQCIIETHSEYLINRFRFRAAAAVSDEITRYMTIYFVEKRDERSQFRPVIVNEFGAIQDWPEGFFDQSQHEAEETLKAAVKKRRQTKPNA